MKRTMIAFMLCLGVALTAMAKQPWIYDFKAQDNQGKEVKLADYEGKVLMIVNTASKCGFTPQYKGLQSLYEKYKDQGLVILAFPCNQFRNQEPGTNAEIAEFCSKNYGVTFPLMDKIEVNGENAHPIYKYLKDLTGGEDIKWNFEKFLISRDGSVIRRYTTRTTPNAIEMDIQNMLSK